MMDEIQEDSGLESDIFCVCERLPVIANVVTRGCKAEVEGKSVGPDRTRDPVSAKAEVAKFLIVELIETEVSLLSEESSHTNAGSL